MTSARSPQDSSPDQGDAASEDIASEVEVTDTWPHGISRDATMRISDVLASLRLEFPAISHSKLRFLEEQGLVEPVRTASGYRKYSPADVERLRFVLVEQRDRYLPLKVIKDKLSALDEGVSSSDRPLIPRLVSRGGETASTGRGPSTTDLLAAECGVPVALVEELVNAGVLRPDAGGRFDAFARDVVELAAQLGVYGIEARHLRTLRSAADRHVTLVDQVVSPLRGQLSPSARGQAGATASELGELLARMHTVWVRQGIDDLPR